MSVWDAFKLRNRLNDLEDAMATIKRRMASIEIEWADTLDRLKSSVGRISKERARMEAREEASAPPVESPVHAQQGADSAGGRYLTPRQLTIQQQVLARRARGNGGNQ